MLRFILFISSLRVHLHEHIWLHVHDALVLFFLKSCYIYLNYQYCLNKSTFERLNKLT